jgi:tRNA G18 (ribose-2'-O)-methylase SpoU
MNAIESLREEGYTIYAVEQVHNSIMLDKARFNPTQKYALVFGNEAEGVQESTIAACHGCIEIPQFGSKHSFNISVATGIVLWEMVKQLKA